MLQDNLTINLAVPTGWNKLDDHQLRYVFGLLAQSQPKVIVQESKDLKEIIARLNERLDEPFVTVNTVTGDKGIKQAQDEYQRLMNNKSPKNKRR